MLLTFIHTENILKMNTVYINKRKAVFKNGKLRNYKKSTRITPRKLAGFYYF